MRITPPPQQDNSWPTPDAQKEKTFDEWMSVFKQRPCWWCRHLMCWFYSEKTFETHFVCMVGHALPGHVCDKEATRYR